MSWTAQSWNRTIPTGTTVRYWPGVRQGPGKRGKTRSGAWLLCGTPVVMVTGQAGGVALTHVEPLRDSDAVAQPVPLFRRGGEEPVAWACGGCGALRRDELQASRCYSCAPRACGACGDLVPPRDYCVPCSRARSEKREREAFEAAEKVKLGDYEGPLFWEGGFYHGLDDLLDHVEAYQLDQPDYAWAARKVTPRIDAETVLQDWAERMDPPEELYEDVWSCVEGFTSYMESWNAAQSTSWWVEDRSRAVLLGVAVEIRDGEASCKWCPKPAVHGGLCGTCDAYHQASESLGGRP